MKDIIPPSLTKEFLIKTLENGLKISNIDIKDFTVSLASGKGENYTSQIFRVCVNYKVAGQNNHQISLIVKNVEIPEGEVKEVFDKIDVVNIEKSMYSMVIREIENLFGNSIMFAPKYFDTTREEKLIVLADLKAMGYELQNRLVGLDEVHCIAVMKKIAQLHAGSMCITKKNPTYAELFKYSMFNEYNVKCDFMLNVFTLNFQQMIAVAKSWPDYEQIVLKLEKICSNLLDRGYEHCKRKEGDVQVINHADLWVNNMMFKYEKGNETPSDVAFVDLQLSYYGSLGIDINYFFNTSPQLEVLKSKRMELLKIYYETLKSSLLQLKYSPIPSWEEVCKEVRAKEFYGLVALGCVFPIIVMDKSASQNSSIDTMLDDSEQKIHAMFGSERMKETLKYSLKRLDEIGVLDE